MSRRMVAFLAALVICGGPGLLVFILLWALCFDPILAAFIGCCVVGLGIDVLFNGSKGK